MRWDLEELARGALERTNVSTPVDTELVALELGLEVYDGGPGCDGLLVGRKIYVDESLRTRRRAFAIGHEVGHHLQRSNGLRDTEDGANYIASALLLPRLDFEPGLRRLGWDLIALCAEHRFASFEAVARRIVALRDARAFVFDKPLAGQRKPFWYSIPYGQRPTDQEREAAREAAASGVPVEICSGITAWPLLEHDWHRVICLANV